MKGKPKSFQSRNTGGERIADMTYPSKLYHRQLSAIDDNAFAMGNLKYVSQSKNVIKQCGYEYRKGNRLDEIINDQF